MTSAKVIRPLQKQTFKYPYLHDLFSKHPVHSALVSIEWLE